MDTHLQSLLREHEAQPADVSLARRLDAALTQAGHEPVVRGRRFDKYLCPAPWESLTAVDRTSRYCPRCDATVRLCGSWSDLADFAEVVPTRMHFAFGARGDQVQEVLSLLADERLHTAREERPLRGHLAARMSSAGSQVLEVARAQARLFEPLGLWVLPYEMSHTYSSSRDLLTAPARPELDAFLELARRLVPPGRTPLLVVVTHLRRVIRCAPVLPRQVLAWIGQGEGGGLVMPCPPWVRDRGDYGRLVRDLLAERQRLLEAGPLRVTCVATPGFADTLAALVDWLPQLDLEDLLVLRAADRPWDLPGGRDPVRAEDAFASLASHPENGPPDARVRLVGFTERNDAQGWLARHQDGRAAIHVDAFARNQLQTSSTALAAHLLAKKLLDLFSGEPRPLHEQPAGCAFDLCREKADFDQRVSAGRLCRACETALTRTVLPPVLHAATTILAGCRHLRG